MARAAGTMTNITGVVNAHELSIIEMKTLQNLTHDSLGLWTSATPDNPTVVAEGGTAIFRAVKLIQFGEYTKANRADEGDLPQSEVKIKADIVGSEKAKYEIESLDSVGLAYGSREAFLSAIAAGVSTSLTALMDAHWLDLAVKTAAANKAVQEVINADLGDLDTDVKQKAAYRQIVRAKIDVARQLDRYNIGANEADFGTILHEFVLADLLLAMPKGGNDATSVGINLQTQFKSVAGLGMVKDHVFLNKKIDAGTVMSKDADFDFTNVFGATAHKEALFVALQGLNTVARINGAGNQELITKFNFYKKAIRPELVRVYRSVATA